MSEEEQAQAQEVEEAGRSADPLFKLLTKEEAAELGLQAGATEFSYSPSADLVLVVPPGLSLVGTMFDFFRASNIVEFKSQNDLLNLRKYIRNEIRTSLYFLNSQEADFDNILNVFVCSRLPQAFLQLAARKKVIFEQVPDQPWRWIAQSSFQTVVIVVCRDLPLEERYFRWLAFAPADSRKWRDYLIELIRRRNQPLLGILKEFRLKEYNMAINRPDILERLREEGLLTPEYETYLLNEKKEVFEVALQTLAKTNPELVIESLSILKPEQRLAGLNPEERLAGLEPEQRLAGLTQEERQALLKKLLSEQSALEENSND